MTLTAASTAAHRRRSARPTHRHLRRDTQRLPRGAGSRTGVSIDGSTRRRFLDTRLVGLPFHDGETRVLHLAGWLPSGSSAVRVIVTVLNATHRGSLTVWAGTGLRPSLATVAFRPGGPTTVVATVKLSGTEIVHMHTSSAADVVVELTGAAC